jgi:hypothetical protein
MVRKPSKPAKRRSGAGTRAARVKAGKGAPRKARPSPKTARAAGPAGARRAPGGTAPGRPTIFISYRHAAPTTEIATKLFTALVPAGEAWNADVFMDDNEVEPADLFDEKMVEALDRTTHFVVLLTNAYWSSDYCRKEVARIVERFEARAPVRLLFVMVEELNPDHFIFAKDRLSGRIKSASPLIAKIGDVQFLGPFDANRRLVRLAWESEAKLGDQLAQLVQRLQRVMA